MLSCCETNYLFKDGQWVNTETQETYLDDRPAVLFTKFAVIATMGHALSFLPYVAYRACDLLSGGWYHRALVKQIHPMEEFGTTLGKFLLIPIGFIAKEIIAIIGLLFCFTAREWYAKVEQFFYIPPKDLFAPSREVIYFSVFTAPCMQPTSFSHEQNFWRYFPSYDSNSLDSLYLRLTLLHKKKPGAPPLPSKQLVKSPPHLKLLIALLEEGNYQEFNRLNEPDSLKNFEIDWYLEKLNLILPDVPINDPAYLEILIAALKSLDKTPRDTDLIRDWLALTTRDYMEHVQKSYEALQQTHESHSTDGGSGKPSRKPRPIQAVPSSGA